MLAYGQAPRAYAPQVNPAATPRAVEYQAFARVTAALAEAGDGPAAAIRRVRAVHDNLRLWGVLADDLLSAGNALPIGLRGQLLSLAEFVRRHSRAAIAGKAALAPLIEINTALMRGLRGEPGPGGAG